MLADLGELERRRGDYEAALPLLERVVAIEQANYGAKDARLAVSLNNLALLQGDRGAWRAAEPLLARAVAIEEEALGPRQPGADRDAGEPRGGAGAPGPARGGGGGAPARGGDPGSQRCRGVQPAGGPP